MNKVGINDFEQVLRLFRSFVELLEYASNTLDGYERVHIHYIGIQLGFATDKLERLINEEKKTEQ